MNMHSAGYVSKVINIFLKTELKKGMISVFVCQKMYREISIEVDIVQFKDTIYSVCHRSQISLLYLITLIY